MDKPRKTDYCITRGKVIFDYSALYCDTAEKLLKSELFEDILDMFLEKSASKGSSSFTFVHKCLPGLKRDNMTAFLVNLFRLLYSHTADEVASMGAEYAAVLDDRERLYEFKEDLYNYWRSRERFLYLKAPRGSEHTMHDIHHARFIKTNEQFKELVLGVYRAVSENLTGVNPKVYRQLPAGANIGILLKKNDWDCPERYAHIRDIPFIELSLIEPPLILYPRENTRRGSFDEISEISGEMLSLDAEEWFCYPARVGELTCFVYFHRDFISLGLSLCNLFEIADHSAISGNRPDLVLMFGLKDKSLPGKTVFYEDRQNGMMVGLVHHSEEVDYFGYFKKMALTLHNVTMLNRGRLPVHGAMVCLKLKDGTSANIAIVGDSGAGKSETLMALIQLAEDNICEMRIIFDDMGSLSVNEDGEVLGYGTEIGAFVRLDDLEAGYAYEEIDRSIFMNPDKVNARLVIPITRYQDVVRGHHVDMFLYANNYDQVDNNNPAIEMFRTADEALAVFRSGARLAKGTTDEKGLVHSYFGNPFGAPQRKEQHEQCARKLFDAMFATGTRVGQFRDRLGIPGYEHEGPKAAALELFNAIRELSSSEKRSSPGCG